MTLERRHNVLVEGEGPVTFVFSHGFGCDQSMWRQLAPSFTGRCRVVTYDLMGAGGSDLCAYDPARYSTLGGYAADLNALIAQYGRGPVVTVGHSVSAMIGVLADRAAPGQIAGHVMVGPSPCYLNEGDYQGGFDMADIEALFETLDSNYLGWSRSMAPVIMGAPGQPALSEELTDAFCRTDPDIAKQFARVTFLSDNRADVQGLATPTLILQSAEDIIAPPPVGDYLHRVMPNSTLCLIDNVGHCPHLSAAPACAQAMDTFLRARSLL
ncbi:MULTISPECIES: alpha/beta fold hydrolase [Pseudomonas]|uniref:Alpha/beta hydrolase n=1 Tax=Pseudomonas quercus TaxID=2722792 RepID=A0ABX0YA84_9PSED|nr:MULTISPECIES: alpha/beta hydrolase [Pseudomonas]MBF7141318.1 alpha/beta hydrolase [Pseudomonas sp. LY10J]NJO99851.1 alpha/beta hydrolase [Pseudomonas quercus]